MIGTGTWPASPIRAADGMTSTASGAGRGRRAAARRWALLHAAALLRGASGGPGDVGFIEDDRRRLAARRAR
jgi:hypothetical protein